MALTYPSNKICPRCGTGGYVWYLDNSEYVAKCTNCGHYFRREDFPMCVLDEAPKPITNYDRIISKTPEELAEWCAEQCAAPNCTGKCHKDYEVYGELRTFCHDCWLDWLKQEAQCTSE